MATFTFRNLYKGLVRAGRDLVEHTWSGDGRRDFHGRTKLLADSGDECVEEIAEERFTISGSSATGAAKLFAANCEILGFGYEIEEAITGATAFLIGDDSGADADRLFAAQTTYTAGTKKQAGGSAAPGAKHQGGTADNVKLTWTGTGTGGKVRVWVHRKRWTTFGSV